MEPEKTYTIGITEDDIVNRNTIKFLAKARGMSRGEFVVAVIKERYQALIEAYINDAMSVSNNERGERNG